MTPQATGHQSTLRHHLLVHLLVLNRYRLVALTCYLLLASLSRYRPCRLIERLKALKLLKQLQYRHASRRQHHQRNQSDPQDNNEHHLFALNTALAPMSAAPVPTSTGVVQFAMQVSEGRVRYARLTRQQVFALL